MAPSHPLDPTKIYAKDPLDPTKIYSKDELDPTKIYLQAPTDVSFSSNEHQITEFSLDPKRIY